MAKIGNNVNARKMEDALIDLLNAVKISLSGFREAVAERERLDAAKLAGSGHTQSEIDTSVANFLELPDVANVQTTFDIAKTIFLDPNPIP